MSHTNSFPTLIAVSQQQNQIHFQQTASSQMQHNAVVNSQVLFPQCQQALSLQSAQNGAMTSSQQLNNDNGNNKQIQHNRQFQPQQQHLTIPLQLGPGNHAFTAAGIPLDLSYFVQGGCLPNCLPIQLTGPGGLQQGFQAALNCVNTSNNDQQQVQASQSDTNTGNSFLQFNVAYQPQQQSQNNLATTFQTIIQSSTNDNQQNPTGCKPQPKRKKKIFQGTVTGGKSPDKINALSTVERFHSVAVQTDFDMSLCRQQIIVVPPKNCTCGAVAQAIASGAFQAASFPPVPRRNDKIKRCSLNKSDNLQADIQQQQQQQDESLQPEQNDHMSPQDQVVPLSDQCNGGMTSTQPNCDNRGRPFSYECLYCPKRFSLHSRLVAHLRCHTGMRPFSCLQCGYSFTQRSYLNRHAAVHKQERPFSCLSCHKTYKHYGSLANHRKLHSKDKSDPSTNETSAVSDSVLPPAAAAPATNTSGAHQLFTVSSAPAAQVGAGGGPGAGSTQMFGGSSSSVSATVAPHHQPPNALMSHVFSNCTTISSMTASQMFHTSSSSTPAAASGVAAGTGSNQIFPSPSQPMATFYQPHDVPGFLLSLNSSAASSAGATSTMLLFHPSNTNNSGNNNNSITVPSSSSSAYVPIMSSSAFS